MSSVDERVVKMVFDNSQFESKIQSTINSLTQLNKSTEQVAENTNGLSAMGKAFEKAEALSTQAGLHIRDIWLKVADTFETQIANRIVNTGRQIANALTMEGVSDGFREYELKMGSIQTIMAGTGESLATVNKYLDELNTYSDQTIYSFADMTNNIGKFTNAGVKLEDAVAAIKGIANEAAISGANANEASRAMYNFSQALSAGYVKLIDWKSIENANMATKGFKDTLLTVASTVGTVEKQADGMYKVLTTNANGATMKESVSATKNFNDSLQQQWMTTEVLTKALKIYSTDLKGYTQAQKEAFAADLGMTWEQFEPLADLGERATAAASEIKTFTMLIDTLKEAIGSGWAMSWQLLVGDFEEAKALWTDVGAVLGGFIDKQSQARNDMLKLWKDMGGRKDLIIALGNAFHYLEDLIKPVGEAMKEVFPPITAHKIHAITRSLAQFSRGLKVTEDTANKIKSVAKGFFSIFDIAIKAVKAFLNAILPAGKGVSSLAGDLLTVAASLGDFITNLDKSITKGKTFETIFGSIGKILTPIFTALKGGISGILGLVTNLFDGFKKGSGSMSAVGTVLNKVVTDVSNGINNLMTRVGSLKSIFEGLSNVAKTIGTFIGSAFKKVGESMTGFSFGKGGGGLITIFNTLMSGGILYKLYSGLDIFKSVGEGFSEILESVTGAFEDFGNRIKADTLRTTAISIAILAGSLVVVSMVDSNKLLGATAAISALAFALAGAMALLMKAFNAFGKVDLKKSFSLFGKEIFGFDAGKLIQTSVILKAVSQALISMGAAVLMMAVGLKVVSSAAEGGHLWDSFAVVTLMLAELTAVTIVLGKWGSKSKKGAQNLKGMTTALVVMAAALKIVSSVVAEGNGWQSLTILSIMLGELTGIVILVEKFGKYKLGSMLPLVSLAVSLNLVVLALKTVSDALGSDGQHMWQALGIVTILLVELAAACVVLSKFAGFAALGGIGAVLAAGALLIMVQAIKQISDALGQTDQHVWQSLLVIGAALAILAVGLTAMASGIPGAAALLVASAALIVLGAALKIMGSLSIGEIAKSLITLTLALALLAVGLTAMIIALPGAAALVVAAAGLVVLAAALKMFGSMSLWSIIKAILLLAVALAGLAILGTVLSVAAGPMMVFSAGLLAIGVALGVVGVAITLFSAGMQSLIAVVPLGTMAIEQLLVVLLKLIPVLAESLMEALVIIATKISENADAFLNATKTIISIILEALAGSVLKFGEVTLEIILGILNVLTENIPLIAEAGANLMIAYMQAISTYIPEIVEEGYQCAIALINGLADAIENNNADLIAAVDHLMSAVIQAITQWLVEFTPLGLLVPENMKEGIMSGEFNVQDALRDIVDNAVEAIKKKATDFKEAAENLLAGFIEGLKGTKAGQAVSAAAKFGNDIIQGLMSKKGLDENSPSKKAFDAAENVDLGCIDGMLSLKDKVADTAAGVGSDSMEALTGSITEKIPGVDEALGGLTDSFEENSEAIEEHTETVKATRKPLKGLQDDIHATDIVMEEKTEATEENTESTKKNTEAQEANATATGKSGKATKKSADVMDYASGIVEAFTKQYGKLYEGLGETGPVDVANIAIKNLAESTYLASIKAKQAAGENEKTKVSIDEMIKSFTEMKTKIYDSVKSMFEGDSFFQKFELKTEKSMADMLEGMRSNVNAVQSWTTKIAELGNKGLDQGLLKQLAELGPKGFEYVNAFSNATAEQIEEANKLFAQAGALPESSSNTVIASYAQAGLNAVEGFKNGLDKNSGALASAENLGLTSLTALEEALEEHSPSRRTYRDGMNAVKGLANGITENIDKAMYAVRVLCEAIIIKVSSMLTLAKFAELGANVAKGLANGMTSAEAKQAVADAAKELSEIADNATRDYNKMRSPSRLYDKHGRNIGLGFAGGMLHSLPEIESAALEMSKAIKSSLDLVNDIAENDMTIRPVIEPVLDLSKTRAAANGIGRLFPSQSMALASSISIGASSNSGGGSSDSSIPQVGGTQISYVQNNYSPKALSAIDIYRQTKIQLGASKGVVNNYA